MIESSDAIPEQVRIAYGFDVAEATLATMGLINRTWIVVTAARETIVVQRLHPSFSAEVNERIDVATKILAAANVPTPQLIRTTNGANQIVVEDCIWRVLTYMSGTSCAVVPSAAHAREAGRMLAQFHRAFIDHSTASVFVRSNVHALTRHLDGLRAALEEETQHRDYERIARLAKDIFSVAEYLPEISPGIARIVHGDPKISNILFDTDRHAICLVDLDTVGRGPLAFELGDAYRSWCNPLGEDCAETTFSLDLFSAALSGYAASAGSFISAQEVDAIVPATETIYTELAARFCTDALRENYFAWDASKFASRSEHNLVRAYGQLNASTDLSAKRKEASQLVASAFEGV